MKKVVSIINYKHEGNVMHIDAENRVVVQRVKTLTKLPDDWFTGDPPRKDSQGKPIKLMPPTIIFLDSLSDVLSKEYDAADKKMIESAGELHSNILFSGGIYHERSSINNQQHRYRTIKGYTQGWHADNKSH